MKKIAAYLIPVLACFAVGISASFFQASSIAEWYPTLTKPTLTPPNIVFPIAWSVLYLCMGLSLGRLIVRRQHKGIIRLWVLQLIANFLWSILFFTLRNPLAGFIDIVLLNILVGLYIFAEPQGPRCRLALRTLPALDALRRLPQRIYPAARHPGGGSDDNSNRIFNNIKT